MRERSELYKQRGQTLVETLVAIFVMTMGVTAALGLANYSLNASTNVTKQLIGVGLAREGIEIAKNMRDTNWLRGTLDTGGSGVCPDFNSDTSIVSDVSCYPDSSWLSPASGNGAYNFAPYNYVTNGARGVLVGYRVNNGVSTPYFVDRQSGNGANTFWDTSVAATGQFELNYNVTGLNGNNAGFFTPGSGLSNPSGFFRRVVFRLEGASNLSAAGPFAAYTAVSPYNQTNYSRIRVISQVWWTDQKCPRVTDPDSAAFSSLRCKVQLEQVFTNWKNY